MSWYKDTREKFNTYCDSKLPWYKKEHKFARDMHRQSFEQVERVQSFTTNESDEEQTINYFKHFARLLELEVEAAGLFGAQHPQTTAQLSAQTDAYLLKLKSGLDIKKSRYDDDKDSVYLHNKYWQYAAAYRAAVILIKIKEFEISVYNYGKANKTPKQLLKELNEFIGNKENKQFFYRNRFTGVVLTKLIQVQTRMNEQFGKDKYDADGSEYGFSAIKSNFTQSLNTLDTEKSVINNRLQHVMTFTTRFQKEDIQQYIPGFFGKIKRWVSSIFSSSSWFANLDNPEKMAWADIAADVNQAVIPAFLSKGNEAVKRELTQGSLGKKLYQLPNQNVARSETNNEVAVLYSHHKSKVESLLSSSHNGLSSSEQNPRDITFSDDQQSIMLSGPLTKTLSAYMPDVSEQFNSAETYNQFDDETFVAYPEWPNKQLSENILNNPTELKIYANKLAACITHVFAHDRDENHVGLINILTKFMFPALFTMYDVLTVKLDWAKTPDKFVGLQLYKLILESLFKKPISPSLQFVLDPIKSNDLNYVKFFKSLYQMCINCLRHYDDTKKLYRKFDGNSFTDIPKDEHGYTTQEGRVLMERIKAFLEIFNEEMWAHVNNNKNISSFYYDFAKLRYDLRDHLSNVQQGVVKGLQSDHPISILTDSNNHNSHIVKLMASLNALAYQFNSLACKTDIKIIKFFENNADSAGTTIIEILNFINANRLEMLAVLSTEEDKSKLDKTLENIFDLLKKMNNPNNGITYQGNTIVEEEKHTANATLPQEHNGFLNTITFGYFSSSNSAIAPSPAKVAGSANASLKTNDSSLNKEKISSKIKDVQTPPAGVFQPKQS